MSKPEEERPHFQPPAGAAAELPAELIAYLEDLIARGGPEPHEYDGFTAWIDRLAERIVAGEISGPAVRAVWRRYAEHELNGTVQALVTLQRHGYAGDFEVIDAIYQQATSERAEGARWDGYLHAQPASRAVRNRKDYLHSLLAERSRASGDGSLAVLNVASGPGRDMREWFERHGENGVRFDCVEMDANAIAYASALIEPYAASVRFHQANALRFHALQTYDVVWSAGLFDYLSDSLFVRLLRRLLRACRPGGEVVIGNFGDYNPTRSYMEFLGGWELRHRGAGHLEALAVEAGALVEAVHIGAEPDRVNLFLHIRKPE